MFSYLMTAFTALLFVVLTPGVLLTIPPKGSKLVVAVVHGLVFALVYHFTHKAVWAWTRKYEGFAAMPAKPAMKPAMMPAKPAVKPSAFVKKTK